MRHAGRALTFSLLPAVAWLGTALLPRENENGKRPFAPESAGVATAAAAAAVSGDAGIAAAGGAAVDLGRGAGVGSGTLSAAAAKPAASMLHAIATRTILAPRPII